MWYDNPDIQLILEFVRWYRGQTPSIRVTCGLKSEGSCIAFGEFYNLLWRQLMQTTEFRDGWEELRNSPEVVSGVLTEIASTVALWRNRGRAVDVPGWDADAVQQILGQKAASAAA